MDTLQTVLFESLLKELNLIKDRRISREEKAATADTIAAYVHLVRSAGLEEQFAAYMAEHDITGENVLEDVKPYFCDQCRRGEGLQRNHRALRKAISKACVFSESGLNLNSANFPNIGAYCSALSEELESVDIDEMKRLIRVYTITK